MAEQNDKIEKPGKKQGASGAKAEQPVEKINQATEKPQQAEAKTEQPIKAKKKKSKQKRIVNEAIIYILATFNNTIVTVTDKTGNTLCWSTSGNIGFKGSKKSTPFAAQLTASAAAEKAKGMGVRKVEICVKGPGAGRESAIRAIQATGLQISAIRDITPVPHNGCRPPKRRRV